MNELRRSQNRRQNIISAAILVGGTLVAYLIFGPHNSKSQEMAAPKATPVVKTMVLNQAGANQIEITKTAVLSSSGSAADVMTDYSGRIKLVDFEVGDQVTEGQVLAMFDQSSSENSPKVSLESANSSVKLAQDSLDSTQEVADKSVDLADDAVKVAKIQYEQAKQNGDKHAIKLANEALDIAKDQQDQTEETAKLQINAAQLHLQQTQTTQQKAQIDYDKTVLKAPIAGTITAKNISLEDFLNSGQKVAEIVGQGQVQAQLYLNGNEASRVKEGDAVDIVVDDKTVAGKVQSIASIANESNQRYEVKVLSVNDGANFANKMAIIKFHLDVAAGSQQGRFFVPLEAIDISQSGKRVFVVQAGKAVIKNVETGDLMDSQIEVVSGLNADDEVIIENNKKLQENQAVTVSN